MAFLESKQRLSSEQCGNKRFHSTETSLIETTDIIVEAMDKQKVTAVVLLDMSKAFVNLDILLLTLQDIGQSSAVFWFSSYLSNRFQAGRMNFELSDSSDSK